MSNKVSSQLGYLMDILGISATELANFLQVERTNVSKWKTGARHFSKTSSYYESVLRYLIHKNETLIGAVLEEFFLPLYNDISRDENFIPTCLRRFLSNSSPMPLSVYKGPEQNNDFLYEASFSVYKGVQGRQSAIMQLLDTALHQEEPCHIFFFEADQFEWAVSDMNFLNLLIDKIRTLMNKGCKFEVLHLHIRDFPGYEIVLRKFATLCFHHNIKQYTTSSKYTKKLSYSTYIIKDKLLALGMASSSNLNQLYTSIFSDRFTVDQALMINLNFCSIARSPIISGETSRVNQIINILESTLKSREPAYFTGPMPSIITMSYDLLLEILNQNNLPKSEKNCCLRLYKILQEYFDTPDLAAQSTFFFSAHHLVDFFVYESIVQYSLSGLVSSTIIVTKDQYLRHLQDAVEFLEKHTSIKTVVNIVSLDYETLSWGWFKKNLWALVANKNMGGKENKLMLFEDPAQLKIFTDAYDSLYYSTPSEYRSIEYAIKVFKEIIESQNS